MRNNFAFFGLFVLAFAVAVTMGATEALSGRDWLLVFGFAAAALLGAVLVYWSAVRQWVANGNHPFTLRQLAAFGGVIAWTILFGILAWRRGSEGVPLPGTVLLLLGAFVVVGTAVAFVAFRSRRRFRGT